MSFGLKIATDNAAFEGEELPTEVARILRDTADRIEAIARADGFVKMGLRDINGNTVGWAALGDDDA